MFYPTSVFALGLCAGALLWGQEPSKVVVVGDGAPGQVEAIGGPVRMKTASVHVISAEFSMEGRTVVGSPYSAEATTTTTQTLADGNRITNTNTSLVARDSEGRTRREQTLKAVGQWATGQNPPAMIFIHDPVAQVSYVLEPNTKTARKRSLAGGAAGAMEAAFKMKVLAEAKAQSKSQELGISISLTSEGEGETLTESLGAKTIEGVQADGKRVTRTIAAGAIGNEKPITIVTETWTSPDLGVVVMSRFSDPRAGETVYELKNIQRTEPDPALFTVPTGSYTIKPDRE